MTPNNTSKNTPVNNSITTLIFYHSKLVNTIITPHLLERVGAARV